MAGIPLMVIAGPTACGKSALAVSVAQKIGAEIVSADSMQIYDALAVSTARPTPEEMKNIPHYLLGHVPYGQEYSVARYAEEARQCIQHIVSRGKPAILCGGTGLYIAAVTENVQYLPQESAKAEAIRKKWDEERKKNGNNALWLRLNTIDPELAASVHPHNVKRVMRALEVWELTGIPLSRLQKIQKQQSSPFDVIFLILEYRNRQKLYDRINARADRMLLNGLLEELAAVIRIPARTANQAIGCKEFLPYFNGECTLTQALDQMKLRTRQYAKRQLTWFHRIPFTHTIYADDYTNLSSLTDAALKVFFGGGYGSIR